MTRIDEIAPDVFRISLYVKEFNLQFNHFLIRDDQPLLYHTGMRGMFAELQAAVAKLIDLSQLRWISWSHFEMDECGSLNDWLSVAPSAQAACSLVGAIVNVNDFAVRPPHGLTSGEVIATGRYRFRFHATPHMPHGWDAGVLFEETNKVLFCSDLLHHVGEAEPLTESAEILERTRNALVADQSGPLMGYLPFTHRTTPLLQQLASFQPTTLAVMHGSSFRGDGGQILRDLAPILRDVLGEQLAEENH